MSRNNRWHMNRIGFVNFWLYDEEVFSFSDGKLLLRGQNGSGKSITTQSFIPFILDGDRTPGRLDPFGSSDRRMEYYFLGENEKEESTGYLFLEFKRENLEQYRTIGIGQRAQKGKPMAFWGFVVLDGRRIGYDMELYKEAGAKKIPRTKQELKNLLGEENPFTESQKEYMSLVNRYLFGFADLEQYGQFIRLLIKVRAPKLSKEFKPTKVYEILNDSLQTLSDGDMRAMVEAMENMDDIQNRLENLRKAFQDVKIIRSEYLRYNRYMLGRKALIYLEEKKKTDGLQGKLELKTGELEAKAQEIQTRLADAEHYKEETELLKAEKGTLRAEDIDAYVEELQDFEKKLEEEKQKKHAAEARIEESREQILLYDGRLRECRGRIEQCQAESEKYTEELEEQNEILQMEPHRRLRDAELAQQGRDGMLQTEPYRGFQDAEPAQKGQTFAVLSELKETVRQLQKTARDGYEALKEQQAARLRWDGEEEKQQAAAESVQEAKEQYEEAKTLEYECRDELIEQFYVLQSETRELLLSGEDLEYFTKAVRTYADVGDFTAVRDRFYRIRDDRNKVLNEEKHRIRAQRDLRMQEKQKAEEELRKFQEMELLSPPHDQRREEARRKLKERGISFLPFFEALEFEEDTPQETKDRIEWQLSDAGLLDALVVSGRDYERAAEELKELSDVLIRPRGEEGAPYPCLRAADQSPDLREETGRILRSIASENRKDASLVLGADGYFRNGILEGYSHPGAEAAFIGVTARKHRKEAMIRQKKLEIEELDRQLAALETEIAKVESRLARLEEEYGRLPSFDDLDQAVSLCRSTGAELERRTELQREQEARTRAARNEYKEAEQKVIRLCRPLPYLRKPEVYQEVLDAAEEYRETLGNLEHVLSRMTGEQSRYADIGELIQKEEQRQEDHYGYLRQADRRIAEFAVRIRRIREYLEDPQIQRMAKRLKEINGRLEELDRLARENDSRLAVSQDNVRSLTEETAELKEQELRQSEREGKALRYFEEELSLGLVMKQEGRTVREAAREAQAEIRRDDRTRSASEITLALIRNFQEHLGTLVGYGISMEDCFAHEREEELLLRHRQRIFAIWRGQKLYLEEFYAVLKEAIESTELLIRQKDRELFEGILADTLSRKLSYRIRESRNWIHEMSELMKKMDTSMALTFSLDWRPKTAEGEEELDTRELEKILTRERELLTDEDIGKVSAHFRSRIHAAKQEAEENGGTVNYMDLVRDALDYRKWFEFRMNYYRNHENKKELTNGAFNRFSGGEKAMAMYVPLFAAINAQYNKALNKDHPRVLALDEAFAGVDDKNISSMFELVQKLDFDYIMNSQVLWGCYETVKSLEIAELLRPANLDLVTVIYYHWNGRERVLDEQ